MISQAMIVRMTTDPPTRSPVHTTSALCRMHCREIKQHSALPLAQVMAQLGELPPWQYQNGRLCLRQGFSNYSQTLKFVQAVAAIADQEDHHPVIEFGFSHAVVLLDTHDVAGISMKDFICAAKVSALG
jgi:4a-hydroxytetrahydrobiopterin dehydratase